MTAAAHAGTGQATDASAPASAPTKLPAAANCAPTTPGQATAITPATKRRAGVPATLPASSGRVRAPVSRIRPASNTPCRARPMEPDASHQMAGKPMDSAFSATPSVADAPSIVAISVRNTARLPRSCPAAM